MSTTDKCSAQGSKSRKELHDGGMGKGKGELVGGIDGGGGKPMKKGPLYIRLC